MPTATRLRAMQRGQCSTVSQTAFWVIVSPHRGQFKYGGAALVERGGGSDTAALMSRAVIDAYLATPS